MKTEMDILKMDERQRLTWYLANRGTLIAVGATWIGMIGWDLVHGRVPTFLILMVPVFALLRLALFLLYGSRPLTGSARTRRLAVTDILKIVATIVLAVAIFLPVYGVGKQMGETPRVGTPLSLVRDDAWSILPLILAYLWPVLPWLLARRSSRPAVALVRPWLELLLAVLSSVLILWIPQLIFGGFRLFFFVLFVPLDVQAEWGCYLAVAANGLYLAAWLADYLSPASVQDTTLTSKELIS